MSHNLTGITTDPKIVKTLATKHIVQVACGYRHCLALTNGNFLFHLYLSDSALFDRDFRVIL